MNRCSLVKSLMVGIAALALLPLTAGIAGAGALGQALEDDAALVKKVVDQLNQDKSVKATEDSKSYRVLFDAYLELAKPPFEIGPLFNASTIHPKMSSWSAVSGWGESNAKMAQAILACKDKIIIGLPYGRDSVEPKYAQANLYADVSLRGVHSDLFPYLRAIDVIAAFATAEMYRLLEAGQTQQGLDLAVANLFVLRQCCDREFVAEKLQGITLLSTCLSNLRNAFYTHQDRISAEQYSKIALREIPFLRPERDRLFMPEADRLVSEALLEAVFDPPPASTANEEKFTATFAEIQAREAPLERFGAAKRWRNIAAIHSSLESSKERLELIYDDWWRRWRVDAYDPILDHRTEFERTNPIRFAAVIYALQDVEQLFEIRNRLIVEVNGAAMAAGLCAYKKTFGTYPDQSMKIYTQFLRRRSDTDPYNKRLGPFGYIYPDQRVAIDTPYAPSPIWVEKGEPVLFSQGQDHEDVFAKSHTDEGAVGTDIVLWPPMTALAREQGFLE